MMASSAMKSNEEGLVISRVEAGGPSPGQRPGHSPSSLNNFLLVHPQAMGTVQVMVGVFIFLCGLVMAITQSIGVLSGIYFWGPVMYIVAGSFTIAAGNSLNRCLVKAALGTSVVAAIAAGLGVGIHCADFLLVHLIFCNGGGYVNCEGVTELSIVIMTLSVLELIVSICVSAFACRATCGKVARGSSRYERMAAEGIQVGAVPSQKGAPTGGASQP